MILVIAEPSNTSAVLPDYLVSHSKRQQTVFSLLYAFILLLMVRLTGLLCDGKNGTLYVENTLVRPSIYIDACNVKPYDILKVKNALENSVYYARKIIKCPYR